MVAPRRGRGAKQAVSKVKQEETDPEAMESTTAEGSNGEGGAEQQPSEEQPQSADEAAESTEIKIEAQPDTAAAGGEPAVVKQEEEKVEPGKIFVDNLPSSLLFEYQDRLKELFSKYGEVLSVKRGPIVVTELTTTPTLSAIVEFKNKDSLDKAVAENGASLDGSPITVMVQPSTVDTTVLVGVPFEATNDYVRLLFGECGEVAQIQEFSKTKYKILRVTYMHKDSIEKALKLDRELRINGFLVTVTKYREDDEQRAQNNTSNKNKRQHTPSQNRSQPNTALPAGGAATPVVRNNFRGGRGGFPQAPGGFRGGRGRGNAGGFVGRGGSTFVRGGGGGYRGAPRGGMNNFMGGGRGGFMGRGGYMMDGQRPNKRMRQE